MIEEPLQVNIRILDKEYQIACAYHEQDDLRASARLLDGRMREIRQTGRVIGTDRIAVMAALNIAHDLIQLQRSRADVNDDSGRRLRQLQDRVNSALSEDTSHTHEPPLDASDERV